MNVVFNMIRANIIYHKLNVFNIESSSTDTCRYKNIPHSLFEILNCKLSVCLIHSTMKYKTFVAYVK
jgi:hypothetical protein